MRAELSQLLHLQVVKLNEFHLIRYAQELLQNVRDLVVCDQRLLVNDEVLKLCHLIIALLDATLELMHEVVAVNDSCLYIMNTVLQLTEILLELANITLLEFLDLEPQLRSDRFRLLQAILNLVKLCLASSEVRVGVVRKSRVVLYPGVHFLNHFVLRTDARLYVCLSALVERREHFLQLFELLVTQLHVVPERLTRLVEGVDSHLDVVNLAQDRHLILAHVNEFFFEASLQFLQGGLVLTET